MKILSLKIKKVKKLNNFIIIAILAINYQIANEVAYIRYFEDDLNFKSNISMLSTERRGLKHMAVSYDENNQPVKIEYFTARGVLDKREMLKYDDNEILIERGFYNDDWKYESLILYGENEPWSKEFRQFRYSKNEPLTFTDQQTHFTVKDGAYVTKIVFETIDGQKYGQIELDYDYLGYLSEERWRDLPSGRIIRQYKYKFELIKNYEEARTVVQIWEYGYDNQLISNVALDMAPSDQLYKTPPSRTNNTLDEVDIIKAEIKEGRVIVPHEAIIPVMMQDHLIMRNGDQLFVDFVNMTESGIQFRIKSEQELLTIPLHKVQSLTSRMGDVIYPKHIHQK